MIDDHSTSMPQEGLNEETTTLRTSTSALSTLVRRVHSITMGIGTGDAACEREIEHPSKPYHLARARRHVN
jgi:hypothetical protein